MLENLNNVVSKNGMTTHDFTKVEYKAKRKFGTSAIKKEEIVSNILGEEDQLNLLASLMEEYLLTVGYSSPLFDFARGEFAKIRAVLNEQ